MVVFGPQIPMYQHPPGRQAEYAPDGTPITPPRDRTTEVLLSSFCSVCLIRERKRTRCGPRFVRTHRFGGGQGGSFTIGMSMFSGFLVLHVLFEPLVLHGRGNPKIVVHRVLFFILFLRCRLLLKRDGLFFVRFLFRLLF